MQIHVRNMLVIGFLALALHPTTTMLQTITHVYTTLSLLCWLFVQERGKQALATQPSIHDSIINITLFVLRQTVIVCFSFYTSIIHTIESKSIHNLMLLHTESMCVSKGKHSSETTTH